MNIQLLVTPDCPHATTAADLLHRALADTEDYSFEILIIRDIDEALARGFLGSPSIHVDGHDLFETSGIEPSLGCRIYRSGNTHSPIPELSALKAALERHATPE